MLFIYTGKESPPTTGTRYACSPEQLSPQSEGRLLGGQPPGVTAGQEITSTSTSAHEVRQLRKTKRGKAGTKGHAGHDHTRGKGIRHESIPRVGRYNQTMNLIGRQRLVVDPIIVHAFHGLSKAVHGYIQPPERGRSIDHRRNRTGHVRTDDGLNPKMRVRNTSTLERRIQRYPL